MLTSSAETSDNTSDKDEVCTLGCSLQGTSNKSKHGSKEETVDSADSIGCPSSDETANNGTKIVLQAFS